MATYDFTAEWKGAQKTSREVASGNWKVQREGIKAQLKIANGQLRAQKEQMQRIGIPTMEANIWYQQQQVRLADQTFQMTQANLGLEYLKFASTLRGPENYFQASDFARGATSRQDVPVFVQQLLNNIKGPAFQGSGATPDPVTAESLMAKLTGSTPSSLSVNQDNSALNGLSDILSNGAHRLAPGTLENLDQSEISLLSSAGDRLGFDIPRWLRNYANSRTGTENPVLA